MPPRHQRRARAPPRGAHNKRWWSGPARREEEDRRIPTAGQEIRATCWVRPGTQGRAGHTTHESRGSGGSPVTRGGASVRPREQRARARGKRQPGAPQGLSVASASDLGLSLRTYPTCLQYTEAVTLAWPESQGHLARALGRKSQLRSPPRRNPSLRFFFLLLPRLTNLAPATKSTVNTNTYLMMNDEK